MKIDADFVESLFLLVVGFIILLTSFYLDARFSWELLHYSSIAGIAASSIILFIATCKFSIWVQNHER